MYCMICTVQYSMYTLQHNMQNFAPAGRAEILRSSQKDEEFCDELQISVSDFVGEIAGQRLWFARHNVIQHLTQFIYKSCTTLRKLQTLGEEYTGIVQVDASGRQLPARWQLVSCVLLESAGTLLLHQLMQLCERALESGHAPPHLLQKSKQLLTTAKYITPFLQHFHKTLFYLNGSYYSLSKRSLGIKYVLFRSWLKDHESNSAFNWLGIVSAIYLAVTLVHSLRSGQFWIQKENVKHRVSTSIVPASRTSTRCSLCLEQRCNPSCTPCGHIFCWACIHEWLTAKSECPLCREQVTPSRVVRLQNYSATTEADPAVNYL